MADVTIKQHDLATPLTMQLRDLNGPIDLTSAVTVTFHMRLRGATTSKINAAANIVTPATGTVRYTWLSGDTDTPGSYGAEWRITWPGTKPQTVPSDGYIDLLIQPDLT